MDELEGLVAAMRRADFEQSFRGYDQAQLRLFLHSTAARLRHTPPDRVDELAGIAESLQVADFPLKWRGADPDAVSRQLASWAHELRALVSRGVSRRATGLERANRQHTDSNREVIAQLWAPAMEAAPAPEQAAPAPRAPAPKQAVAAPQAAAGRRATEPSGAERVVADAQRVARDVIAAAESQAALRAAEVHGVLAERWREVETLERRVAELRRALSDVEQELSARHQRMEEEVSQKRGALLRAAEEEAERVVADAHRSISAVLEASRQAEREFEDLSQRSETARQSARQEMAALRRGVEEARASLVEAQARRREIQIQWELEWEALREQAERIAGFIRGIDADVEEIDLASVENAGGQAEAPGVRQDDDDRASESRGP